MTVKELYDRLNKNYVEKVASSWVRLKIDTKDIGECMCVCACVCECAWLFWLVCMKIGEPSNRNKKELFS